MVSEDWIDVDEKVPDNGEYVLLSLSNYPIPLIGFYIGDADNGGNFYTDESDLPLIKHGIYVDGWQELPRCISYQNN